MKILINNLIAYIVKQLNSLDFLKKIRYKFFMAYCRFIILNFAVCIARHN